MDLFLFQTQTVIPFTALIHHYNHLDALDLMVQLWPEAAKVEMDRIVIPGVAAFSAGGFLLQNFPEIRGDGSTHATKDRQI